MKLFLVDKKQGDGCWMALYYIPLYPLSEEQLHRSLSLYDFLERPYAKLRYLGRAAPKEVFKRLKTYAATHRNMFAPGGVYFVPEQVLFGVKEETNV